MKPTNVDMVVEVLRKKSAELRGQLREAAEGPYLATQKTLGARTLEVLAHALRPLDVRELAAIVGVDPSVLRTVVWRLAKSGEVVKEGRGYRLRRRDEAIQPLLAAEPDSEES
ncbi:hypothetical protein VZQ01_06695 [Myxococcus faecalis]|uniref:hypothetical protein n=1 Tax=Myxococcus faecalis TaxID=3115646 RepID=UPI003CFA9444